MIEVIPFLTEHFSHMIHDFIWIIFFLLCTYISVDRLVVKVDIEKTIKFLRKILIYYKNVGVTLEVCELVKSVKVNFLAWVIIS